MKKIAFLIFLVASLSAVGQRISDYTHTATSFASGDLFDVSKLISTGPNIYQTQKFTYGTLSSFLFSHPDTSASPFPTKYWVSTHTISGSGTLNYLSLWTPNGTTLSSSDLRQSTTGIQLAPSKSFYDYKGQNSINLRDTTHDYFRGISLGYHFNSGAYDSLILGDANAACAIISGTAIEVPHGLGLYRRSSAGVILSGTDAGGYGGLHFVGDDTNNVFSIYAPSRFSENTSNHWPITAPTTNDLLTDSFTDGYGNSWWKWNSIYKMADTILVYATRHDLSGVGTVSSVASADGSITVTNPTTTVDLSVVKAPKWTTGRTIGITGDVTYTSPSFDGSGNVTAAATVTKINGTSLAGLATGILKNTTSTGVPSIAIAADFPTLNQNTSGSAATLTTPRSIYGNNFDGSAALAQIIASTFGGTGNGFTKFSGPTTSEKTFTLPNASATVLTDNAVVTAAQGGTGVANSSTITIAGNLTHSGAFTQTFTATGNTSVTLPLSGTLATLAGSEAFTNKTYNGNTWTAGTGTLTLAASKTFTASNTLTLAGTDGTTMTFPSTSATIARTDAANTFTGHQTIEGVTSTGATGTGKFVFDGSPTIATPTLSTSFTSPLHIGGTGTTSTLAFQTTSGAGTTGADFIWKSGNNGATELMRLQNSGTLLLGATSPISTENFSIQNNQNAKTFMTIGNNSSGNAAQAASRYTNGTNFIEFGHNGTSYTTSGGFIADGSYVYDGGSIGLSFMANGGAIQMYTGGIAAGNERIHVASGGNVGIGTTTTTYLLNVTGDVGIATTGKTLRINTGTAASACMGTGTLSGGTVTISTTCAPATTAGIFVMDTQAGVVNIGTPTISSVSSGVSFTVTSSNVLDASTFNWVIFKSY